jgi:hypothetical protein
VLFGTEKFRKYIEHQQFILETDNQALSWLLFRPRQLGKIGRWVAKTSALKFEVKHIRGTQNVVADALSRMFEPTPEEKGEIQCLFTLTNFPLAFQELKRLQGQDPELVEIRGKLLKGEKIGKYLLSKDLLYWCSGRGRGRKI